MSGWLWAALVAGWIIAVPRIYRAFVNDLKPTDDQERVLLAFVSGVMATIWPMLLVGVIGHRVLATALRPR